MLLLISLGFAILFTALCGDILKKKPVPFYVGASLIALFFAVFTFKSVPVIVREYIIVDIKVESDETDEWYLDNVKNEVIPRILEREGEALDSFDDIDAVSGATLSSNGVKRAVRDALDQAKI